MITKRNVVALFQPEVAEQIFQGTVKQSKAMSLFYRLPDMATGVEKLRVLDALPVAYWVNETKNNGRKNITRQAWENKYITAEEIAVIVPIKENLLEDADVDIWAQVYPRIAEAFGKKFDQAVFQGVDKPNGYRADLLTSITNAGAVITQGANETLYSVIDKAMAKVEESDYLPNGILGGLNLKSKFRNMLDTNGQPLFKETEISDLPRYYVDNGAWDKTKALAVVGDFRQAVYAIRKDLTYKILDQAVIQDPDTGDILYNLAQEDMVALRCVMRIGWEIPNPVNAEALDGSVRFPFAAIKGTGDAGITTQDVEFTVSDGASSSTKYYKDAEIRIAGLKKLADATGKATFKLQAGTYDYSVYLEGHAPVFGKATVESAKVTVAVTLK